MRNVLIVLGNGFDLDLGLKTSYRNFWDARSEKIYGFKSTYIPELKTSIQEKVVKDRWIDLEEYFRDYASSTKQRNENIRESMTRTSGYKHEYNQFFFEAIRSELTDYLKEQQEFGHLKTESCAAKLLRKYAESNDEVLFYSFNYTDINVFAQKLGIQQPLNLSHIHGSLQENNIVLGIGDDAVYAGNDYLLKEKQGAKTELFKDKLFNANEVIIFGMAFGFNDIHYFRDYFNTIQSNPNKPSITIYTRDSNECNNIAKQLIESKIDVNSLRNIAHLHFEPTI